MGTGYRVFFGGACKCKGAICLSALDLPGPRGTEPALGRGVVGRRLESGLDQNKRTSKPKALVLQVVWPV